MTESRTAVLLIAHGSRRLEANRDLAILADRIREHGSYETVVPSYLELAEPKIPDGAHICIAAGASRVLMLPFFLAAGNHVVEDLERHRQELAVEFPDVEIVLCPPLGLHPLMTEIVADRLAEGKSRFESA